MDARPLGVVSSWGATAVKISMSRAVVGAVQPRFSGWS